jgi:MFS family permease
MAVGTAIYALATLCISSASGFWGFWLCMVLMTCGELMLVPTSSTYAANLAPGDMRGRYMSIYGLSWGVASGVSSPLGGFLNDTLGPKAIWYGASMMGILGMSVFLRLRQRHPELEILVD